MSFTFKFSHVSSQQTVVWHLEKQVEWQQKFFVNILFYVWTFLKGMLVSLI
jgi:hypothetical protein